MKKLYLILLIVFIYGCSQETVVCHNETVTIVKEVVKNVEVTKPCNCPICEENKIEDATQKLIFCNIRYDELNKLYFQCLQGNNSQYMENLQEEIDDLKDEVEYWKNESSWC